ncbi:heterokaryon incompatibility protein-domain-containing protein [Coniochaeta sp. 2T2.1]|nr:heterokaryon incompatibility protein-domain-containing protein [Coniochaeta sp. 2T2.1]
MRHGPKPSAPVIDQEQGTSRDPTSTEPRPKANTDPSFSPVPSFERAPFPDGVALWHDCPDATVDICFVHGLTGNRDSTWTAHGQREPWPKTLLPPKLPRARLLTYGYDAYVVRKSAASANRLIDHAANLLTDLTNDRASHNASSRRLVFVAHSLGGLVCKEAVLLWRNNPTAHLRGIFDCVVGIAFMGRPHRGSWMADWAKVPASGLGPFKSNNKSLLAILGTHSQLLESGQARFWSMVREVRESGSPLEVTCFFEELPVPAVGRVVPKESATLEGYTAVSVHEIIETCQQAGGGTIPHRVAEKSEPRSLADLPSADVQHQRKPPVEQTDAKGDELGSDHNTPAVASGGAVLPCYHLPLRRNTRFVGREAELDALKDLLFGRRSPSVALVGLGGVGKTQAALEIAYWVKEKHPEYSIFWLAIRKAADDEDVKESVRRHLSSAAAGPWLLVVDNADDVDVVLGSSDVPGGVSQYLPDSESGLVLYTTRSPDVASRATSEVELHQMSEQEARIMFDKSLKRKGLVGDEAVVEELLGELMYLPLAIAQATAYLDRNRLSVAAYLTLLRGAEEDMVGAMSREFHDSTRYRGSQNAVATTWLVSFDQIRKTDGTAAELLSFISQIEPKAIPRSILPRPESEEKMVHAIGTLCGYAFLGRREESDMIDMHSLVHVATRVWIGRQGRAGEAEIAAVRHFVATFPSTDLANRHCLGKDRRFKEAIRCFEEAYEWRKEHLVEEDDSRLASEHELASAYHSDRRIKEAIEMLEHVRPKFEALSYMWGTELAGEPITLNSFAFEVKRNLLDALLFLRRQVALGTARQPFWIDAICINQKDVAERNRQLPIMEQIYSRAATVVVWLGNSRYTEFQQSLAGAVIVVVCVGGSCRPGESPGPQEGEGRCAL